MDWHSMPAEAVLKELRTSFQGLSQEEVEGRLAVYGFNDISNRKPKSVLFFFLKQFKSFIIYILAFSAIVSASISHWTEFAVILGIILFVAMLGFVQEYRADRALSALKALAAPKARAVRGGNEIELPARGIVPGDIVLLEAGDRVPADCRLLEQTDLSVDESILTGESVPVEKDVKPLPAHAVLSERRNSVYCDTYVTEGVGTAVVVATDNQTEVGKIACILDRPDPLHAPIQAKLVLLSKQITVLALAICAVVFAVEVLKGSPLYSTLLIVAALSVSGIPESLPAVITLTLAEGVHAMSRRHAIIRAMPAVETLGSTTVICTDKTGTLTEGKMTVSRIFSGSRFIEVTGYGHELIGKFLCGEKPSDPKEISLLLKACVLCNRASIETTKEGVEIIGSAVEGALLVLGEKGGFFAQDVRAKYPKLAELPFNPERRRMSTVHLNPSGGKIAFVKGGPRKVLECCSRVQEEGRVRKLDSRTRKRLLEVREAFAGEGLMVFALAYRKLPTSLKCYRIKAVERDLTFLGFLGISDVIREGVPEAVRTCREAGIRIAMITGDNSQTAQTIGRNIGLFSQESRVLSGAELEDMSDVEFEKIVNDVSIYVRASPEHKLRIVEALKRAGNVVAMTGDGVNDAPALKNADIGIAMGVGGTDVARESSDMILVDNNFSSIMSAVREGRVLYDNTRKFIYYLLVQNFAEVLLIVSTVMLSLPLPITPLMILWVNLVTGAFPAFGLCVERGVEDIMRRPPRDPKEEILTPHMRSRIFFAGMVVFAIAFSLFAFEYYIRNSALAKAQTVAFAGIIMAELFHAFNARSFRLSIFKIGFFSNKTLVYLMAFSVLSTVSVIYLPFLQNIFGTVPLGLADWERILAASSLVIVAVEIEKYLAWRRQGQ